MIKPVVTVRVNDRGWDELKKELAFRIITAKAGVVGPRATKPHRRKVRGIPLLESQEAKGQISIQRGLREGRVFFEGVPQRFTQKRGNGPATEVTNALVAAVHEFGLGTNPERSFIRSTLDENSGKYDGILTELAKKVYDRQIHAKEALGRFARRVAIDIRKKITDGSGVPPPLQSDTIKNKVRQGGTAHTLILTEQLVNAVTAEIQSRGLFEDLFKDKLEGYVEEMAGGVE